MRKCMRKNQRKKNNPTLMTWERLKQPKGIQKTEPSRDAQNEEETSSKPDQSRQEEQNLRINCNYNK